MGVRNRTIERAPTKPRDKARDDFTTEMTSKVVRQITGGTKPKSRKNLFGPSIKMPAKDEGQYDKGGNSKASFKKFQVSLLWD